MPQGLTDYLVTTAVISPILIDVLWLKRHFVFTFSQDVARRTPIRRTRTAILPLLLFAGWTTLGIRMMDPQNSVSASMESIGEWRRMNPAVDPELSEEERAAIIELMKVKYRRDLLIVHVVLHLAIIPLMIWLRRRGLGVSRAEGPRPEAGGTPPSPGPA